MSAGESPTAAAHGETDEASLAATVSLPPLSMTSGQFANAPEAEHLRQMARDSAAQSRKREDEERTHQQQKEIRELDQTHLLQRRAFIGLCVVGAACLALLFVPWVDAGVRTTAGTLLAAIVAGSVGYAFGKK